MSTIFYYLIFFSLLLFACWLGHVIWVHVILRAFGRRDVPPATKPLTHCLVCGGVFSHEQEACPYCAWETKRPGPFVPARVALRLLSELEQRGFLEPDATGSVRGAIGRWQTYLAQQVIRAKRLEEPIELLTAPPETSNLQTHEVPVTEPNPPPITIVTPTVTPPLVPPTENTIEPVTATPQDLAPASEVTERVVRFKEAMAAAQEQATPKEPVAPKQTWSEWLAAFMEEKHIRWGEVIGGLLIVCCSIALVISFWSEIAERQLLKFGVFNGFTAALFGLGIYAGKKWQLPTTSNGMLSIATLLLPLNFLAIAAFTRSSGEWIVGSLAGECISIALFAWLLYLASDLLLGHAKPLFTVAILGPCIAQLVIRRFIDDQSPLAFIYLAAIALVLFYNLTHFIYTRSVLSHQVQSLAAINTLYKFLGLTSFSLLVPLALLLIKSGHWVSTLQHLSPLSVPLAMPALGTGLWLWRKCAISFQGIQTVGATFVVVAAIVMGSGVVMAWPVPLSMSITGVLLFLCLTYLALRFEIYEGHAAAAIGGLIAYVLLVQLSLQHLPWLEATSLQTFVAMTSASSAKLLTIPAVIYGLIWMAGARKGWRASGSFGIVAVAICAISLAFISYRGFGIAQDPIGATWIYLLYALGLSIAAWRVNRGSMYFFAASVALAACAQGIVYRWGETLHAYQPRSLALFVHATVLILFAFILRWMQIRTTKIEPCDRKAPTSILIFFSLFSASFGAILVLASRFFDDLSIPTGYPYWLAAITLCVAFILKRLRYFTGFQWLLATACFIHVYQLLSVDSDLPLQWSRMWQPKVLQAESISMMLLVLLCVAIRWGLSHTLISNEAVNRTTWKPWLHEAIQQSKGHFENVLHAVALLSVVILAVAAVGPGIGQELSPRAVAASRVVPDLASLQMFGLSQTESMQWPTWILTGLIVLAFVAQLSQQYKGHTFGGLVLCFLVICMLSASRFTEQVAVASALRWFTALTALLVSGLLWGGTPWVRRIMRRLHSDRKPRWHELRRDVLISTAFLIIAPMFFLAGYLTLYVLRTNLGAGIFTGWHYVYATMAGIALVLISLMYWNRRTGGWKFQHRWMEQATQLGILLLVSPFLVVTLYVISASLKQHPIVGPDPASFFGRIPIAVSYGVPLLLIAATCIGHAMYQRSSRLALVAGLVLQITTVAAYLMSGIGAMNTEVWIRLTHYAAICGSAYALAWMAYRLWRGIGGGQIWRNDNAMAVQAYLSFGLLTATTSYLIRILVQHPDTRFPLEIGSGYSSWIAWLLVTASVLALMVQAYLGKSTESAEIKSGLSDERTLPSMLSRLRSIDLGILVSLLFLCFAMVSFATHRLNISWVAYHTLLGLVGTFAVLQLAARFSFLPQVDFPRQEDPTQPTQANGTMTGASQWDAWWSCSRWLNWLMIGVVAFLSIRADRGDPQSPWWACGGLAVAAFLATIHGLIVNKQRYLYLAASFINVGVCIWWNSQKGVGASFADLWLWNVISLSLPVVLWRWCDTRMREQSVSLRQIGYGCHRFTTTLSLVALGLVVAAAVLRNALGDPLGWNVILSWGAIGSASIAMLVCLWDRNARHVPQGMYLLGLIVVGRGLENLHVVPRNLWWLANIALGCYVLWTSYVWSRRDACEAWLVRWGVPVRAQRSFVTNHWLITANFLMVCFISLFAIRGQFVFELFHFRLILAQTVLAQLISFALLARGSQSNVLRYMALSFGALGSVQFAWAFTSPSDPNLLIHRLISTGLALAVVSVVYGLGLVKIWPAHSGWVRVATRMMPALVTMSIAVLFIELTVEVMKYFRTGNVPIGAGAIFIVSITLVTLIVACLAAAMLPGRDPLKLSERGRQVYVYIAEAILGALFMHIRICFPHWFSGTLDRYWPMIVMGIAFVGIGLGEYFQKRQLRVVSEPLTRTGVLLPILPVLGFWASNSHVHYSGLLLAVGALYGLLASLRRSMKWGALAALSVHGAVWYLLAQVDGLSFREHPQLWIIPPALSVMVGAHLTREHLTAAQLTNIRYITSSVIYISSTAEMFLRDVGVHPWLPIILAAISIAGIALGIFLRVRAFLFTGTAFLSMALLRVIWFAAVDREQTWLWFVAGILAGGVILAVFAVFEKKRQQVLALIEQLKRWEA